MTLDSQPALRVAAAMTTPVLSVTPETPLQQAVQLLSDHHISGLPVLDAAGALVGSSPNRT